MPIEIKPVRNLDAQVAAPPSKGHTLRALFISALAEGKSVLKGALIAEDQKYAISALRQFGAGIEVSGDDVAVEGTAGKLRLPEETVFVGNSGLTIRFLATFAALAPEGKIIIDGNERMRAGRPTQDLLDALPALGIKARSLNSNGCPPFEIIGGSFLGGKTRLKGDLSSQYFSSILISAPYAKKDVEIECIGEMSSKPYIDMTQDAMRAFGVEMRNDNYKAFSVEAGQRYRAGDYKIEGDYSSAAFLFAAAAVSGGKVSVGNLKIDSAQGDKIFADLLQKMGCSVKKGKEAITVEGTSALKPITFDMNSYPDIVPPLAVVAACAKGKSEFTNIAHLRYKESDRLKALENELKKIGIDATATKDSLIVNGAPEKLHGAEIECYNDHRIAMSFAVLGLKVKGIVIKDEKCVAKSFPGFFDILGKMH